MYLRSNNALVCMVFFIKISTDNKHFDCTTLIFKSLLFMVISCTFFVQNIPLALTILSCNCHNSSRYPFFSVFKFGSVLDRDSDPSPTPQRANALRVMLQSWVNSKASCVLVIIIYKLLIDQQLRTNKFLSSCTFENKHPLVA